jgi:hypothetical protein
MVTQTLPQNPFALLRISPRATSQEVIARLREVVDELEDADARVIYRKAVEAINSNPRERLIHSLWEMPGTEYQEFDDQWSTFVKAFRANPAAEALKVQADEFEAQHMAPDALLELLAPLLNVSRATAAGPYVLDELETQGLVEPLKLTDVF